jgi:hypothetical protein
MQKPLRVPSQDPIEIGRLAYRSPYHCLKLPGTNNICANNGA